MMDWMQFIGPTFRLRIPTNWIAASSPEFQTMFISPVIDGIERANLTLFMQPYDPNEPLSKLIETMAASQAQAYDNYQVLEEGEMQTRQQLSAYFRLYEFEVVQVVCPPA